MIVTVFPSKLSALKPISHILFQLISKISSNKWLNIYSYKCQQTINHSARRLHCCELCGLILHVVSCLLPFPLKVVPSRLTTCEHLSSPTLQQLMGKTLAAREASERMGWANSSKGHRGMGAATSGLHRPPFQVPRPHVCTTGRIRFHTGHSVSKITLQLCHPLQSTG